MALPIRLGKANPQRTLSPGDHVHFVGIGGIGLSAIARILLQRGYTVSGSDLQLSPITQALVQLGARVYQGHSAENVGQADVLVASSAVPRDNPEVLAAQHKHIPVLKRGRMLSALMESRYGIAIAGTHGKTTTTAMIGLVLEQGGLDPTILVGGVVPELGTNAKNGKGSHFVVEADEYDRTFLELSPQIVVVTSIEMDHPDCFTDLQDVSEAFRSFVSRVPADGLVMACGDDDEVMRMVQAHRRPHVATYGLGRGLDWRATNLRRNLLGGNDFQVIARGEKRGEFQLSIPGLHNVSNAVAAIAIADHLRVDLDEARDTLRRFQGVERRFEVKGELDGITVVDDYAHHPTEIKATLAAARQRYSGRRIWVVFQPHTYSRTGALLSEFAAAFDDADRVIITAIYAARETDDLGISANDLVKVMKHPHVSYIADMSNVATSVSQELRAGDLLITMGAGDVWRISQEVLARLRQRGK